MPNSATILSTLTLIIAFNYQHLITKAEDFEDCSKYLNTSPTTTNGSSQSNGVSLTVNKEANELHKLYTQCLKLQTDKKVAKKSDETLKDGMRFKRSVLDGEGMRFKKDPILDEESMRFKKDPLLDEEGLRFRKKSVLDGEGMRFKKDQLLDEEGMRFKKSVLDGEGMRFKKDQLLMGEGMRFKKASVLDGEGMRFKKDPLLDEEGMRFKKSVLDGEGMRFKKASVLDGEGMRFKKSVLDGEGMRFKKPLGKSNNRFQKLNYHLFDETSDERRDGGSSSDILEDRNYFN